MFTKFELIGIGTSVAAMAVALFILRTDTNLFATQLRPEAQTASLVAVDATTSGGLVDTRVAIEGSVRNGRISDLIVTDVRFGAGEAVAVGDTVVVNYIGTLQNGTEFDNSYKRGQPFSFKVGQGRVIVGWEEGIVGMKVGGQRVLVIPSEKAYGSSGFGPIPGNATLVFAIELLEIK